MYRLGPLAPGMRIRLEVELNTAVTLAGNLSNRPWFIEVSSEARVIRVPLGGMIMPTSEEYAQAEAALQWKHQNKSGIPLRQFSVVSKLVRVVQHPPSQSVAGPEEGKVEAT
jgi:hypothetical protein